MPPDVRPPERGTMIGYVLDAMARYKPDRERLAGIDVPESTGEIGRSWARVVLPDHLTDLGVDGRLLVDAGALDGATPDDPEAWRRFDWWLALFSSLSGAHEVRHEIANGPIHSYAFRLGDTPTGLHGHAWANRIMRVLLRLAGLDESSPPPSIEVTLDLDAIRKTTPIRGKQSAFELFNAARGLASLDAGVAMRRARRGVTFALSAPDYETADDLIGMMRSRGVEPGTIHAAGRPPERAFSARDWLFDPGYRTDDPALPGVLATYREAGFEIGLHPCYGTWRSRERLEEEAAALKLVTGRAPTRCRQHWLRFSWLETWRAQSQAGITLDSTLGFNDRPGFRAGACLRYHPWDFDRQRPHELETLPIILMDSHAHAYRELDAEARRALIGRLLGEVASVGGEAAILWHPHTLASDYGWRDGFAETLDAIGALGERHA